LASKGSGRTVGRATLYIIPKLQGRLTDALGDIGTAGKVGGTQYGGAFNSGFKASLGGGAIVGAVSSLTTKALSAVTSHIGAAVSRLDTLKNYPTVMHSLGVNADEASASIGTMSERLSSLPTTLDSMSSTVQGIYAATKDYGVSLTTATNAGLALNDMLLAGGQGTQVTMSAMEQFRQMLSKGKPDMQDWKALLSAAPGQMDQLAKSMLGPTASANDLYTALGGGGSEATISMTQLLDAIVKVDTDGGAGLASFKTQAEDATGGIATSAANMGNAITKGLANVMDAIGRENIVGVLNGVKGEINAVFSAVTPAFKKAAPALTGLANGVVELGPAALAAAGGMNAFQGVLPKVESGSLKLAAALDSNKVLKFSDGVGKVSRVLGAFGPFAAIGAAGVGALVAKVMELNEENKREVAAAGAVSSALEGLKEVSDGTGVSTGRLAEKEADWGKKAKEAASDAKKAHEDYLTQVEKSSKAISDRTEKVNASAESMENDVRIIDLYNGRQDLTASQSGELRDAVDDLNQKMGTNYELVSNSVTSYDDEGNAIKVTTDRLKDYVAAKEAANKAEAMLQDKQDVDDAYASAVTDRQKALSSLGAAYKAVAPDIERYGGDMAAVFQAIGDGSFEGDSQAVLAFEDQAAAFRDADKACGSLKKQSDNLSAAQAALTAKAEGAELSVVQMAESSTVAFNAFTGDGDKANLSLASFGEALSDCATNSDALKSAMNDPSTMAQIVSAYDGTAESLHGVFESLGLGWDEQKAKALDAQTTISDMSGFISGLDTLALGAMTSMGESSDTLATKLAGAGVSMEQLNSIGSENFSQMLQNCGGDISVLTWEVQHYNDTPIIDKDGNIHVDDASLMDAQGHVYTWNGTDFVDKDGNAVVYDTPLTDAQGHVYTWNGTELEYKDAEGTVYYATIEDGIANRDEWNKTGLNSYEATNHITTFFDNIVSKVTGHATGGIRLNASGGVRYHADGGAIATRAVPLDIVGEAGAEAIVPLTNRRYSQPFADIIADGVSERMGDGGAVLAELASIRELIKSLRIVLDSGELVGGIADKMDERLGLMQAQGVR
jgi:tape measure domain-containing protein